MLREIKNNPLSTMNQEKHNTPSTSRQDIHVSPANILHGSTVPHSEVLVADVLSQCSASGSCGVPQPPIILSSDLCELTSKFEGESLIKVDSMLAEPCKYLEEVSVFGVDDGRDAGGHHSLVDGTSVELTESTQLLKDGDLDHAKKMLPVSYPEDSAKNQTLKGVVLQDNEEAKESRINLLDTSPFLMSEEGVVFQCFPVSEKDIFIVNLEDETLLMNEPLTEDHLPLAAEPPLEMKLNDIAPTKEDEKIPGAKLEASCQYPLLEASGAASYVQDVPAPDFITSSFQECERNYDSQTSRIVSGEDFGLSADSRTVSRGVFNPSADFMCRSEELMCPGLDGEFLMSSKKSKASQALADNKHQQKDMKVTHATIFAPPLPPPPSAATPSPSPPPQPPPHHPPRRTRKGLSDGEDFSSELYRCSVCNEMLPTSGTLRHHLVTKHQQSCFNSFMCFLCKQDCWSASQQDWHLRIQHGIKKKSLACPVCGTQFSTPTECRAHVRKHSANLTCPSCTQRFAAQHQLTEHVKQHLEELQPHGCQICGIRFTQPKVLEMHAWRHMLQKCPEESCQYVAEDETWLFYHLQERHRYSLQSVRSLAAARNSDDYRMDIILVKYFQTQKMRLETKSSNNSTQKLSKAEAYGSEGTSSLMADDSENGSILPDLMKEGDGFLLEEQDEEPSSIVLDMIETVVTLEEEDKKNIKRKEEVLRKVFDGGTPLYRCGLCNTYHSSPEELSLHKAEHNQVLECVKCQKSFLSVKQLKRHMTVHSSNKDDQKHTNKDNGMVEHHCMLCGKIFGSESALSRHSSTHARSEGRHQCKICSRRVGTRAHLTEHMSRVHKVHSDSKKMQCPMCDRRFVSNFHLNLHLITHGETKPLYSCKVCNRSYLRPRSLRRHMVTHDQNYVCKTCNESFPSSHRLAVHARGHDPAYKSKVQCPKCPMAFPYKSQLEVHLRTHTGEKPYVCETCGKCFKRLQHCKVHLKVMHGNEKQPCIECGKLFSDKANLLRHRLKVHYHLNRWVCGVCAQSFAYSEDLRHHLKRKHSLTFKRLLSADKKCMSEVYVIPELGSRPISASTRAAIECICDMEKQKVQQIFSGIVPDLTRPVPKPGISESDKANDPDDPVPVQQNTVKTRSVFIPSAAAVGLSNVMGNSQHNPGQQGNPGFQTFVNNEVQGLMPLQVTSVKCTECGIEVTNPQQCGACGVLVCSQAHLDVHAASAHQVLFQCSVCGLHYSSQSECVAHVASAHSSHLLAVQGGTATYLPSTQAQNLQGSGAAVQPQLCLPLPHAQPNPQCLLQVGGCPPQLPVVVAPAVSAVASQQIAAAPSCILPYPNVVNGVPAGVSVIPQATTIDPSSSMGKQTVFAMTSIFPDQQQQQATPNIQSNGTQFKREEPLSGASLCTITLPSTNTENLCIPSDNNSVVMLTSKPNPSGLRAIQPHPKPPRSAPSVVVGNSEPSEQRDKRTPVLLVDSETTSIARSKPSLIPASHKINSQMNISQQTNTSVASVLLTLAEPPQDDQSSVLVPSDLPSGSLRITDTQMDQVLSPSIVTDMSFGDVEKDEEQSSIKSSNTNTAVNLPATDEEDPSEEPSLVLSRDMQVIEESKDCKEPQEISVEIIQPQIGKTNLESKPAKQPSKRPSASRVKRKKTSDNSVKSEALECKTCGKMLLSVGQLKRHETTHGVRRFKCQICDKVFTEKYNLKIHALTHTQERPHECSLCLKTFRYLRDFSEHKLMHEGTRPHVCDICQRAFIRQRDLTRHQKELHDTKRYQCKVCGLSFKRLLYLKTVHMRIHHPQLAEANDEEAKTKENLPSKVEAKQSHICKICGRNFARARYLTSHLRTHSKRAYYVRCPVCPRMFSSEQTLKVHKETFHEHVSCMQGTSSMITDSEQNVAQTESLMSNFDQSQTENLVISDTQEISESTASSLVISSEHDTNQLQPHSSKQVLLLPSINIPTSLQHSYSATRSDDVLEPSMQSDRISHIDVSIDECDPITYLAPSYSHQ